MKDEGKQIAYAVLKAAACFALAAWLAFVLSGCKTQVVTVTEYKELQVHDTIVQVDSVWQDRVHIEKMKGDTLVVRDSVYLYKYKYLDKVVEVVQTDSVPYPVEVVREVSVRSKYDRVCSTIVWVLVGSIVLAIGWWLFKKFYLKR